MVPVFARNNEPCMDDDARSAWGVCSTAARAEEDIYGERRDSEGTKVP